MSVINQAISRQYEQDIDSSQGFILTEYKGMSVSELDQLRRDLEDKGARYRVMKNSLLKRILGERKVEGLDDFLKGSTAAVLLEGEGVDAAKVVQKYAKDIEVFNVKAGFLEGQVLNKADVQELSKIPSREELLAKMLMCMNAPVSGFVNVLSGVMRNFACVVNAIKEKKEQEGGK